MVGGGDYNSVKLLKVEEVDLIADDPGLQYVIKQFLVHVILALLLECR